MAVPSPAQVVNDPALFAETFLKIMDKRDQRVRLRYNATQRDYLRKRTRRDLILKARQIGFSTLVQAEHFRYATTRPTRTLTLADVDDNTQKLRRIADRFYDNLPDQFRPERAANNARLTTYPGFDSEVMIATAGNRTTGRAGSYRYIHGSEVAFWPDAGSIVASALQGGDPQWVVMESTPNGQQGWFYTACMEALDGNSVWTLHFYRWFDHAEYQLPVTEPLHYTDDEQRLADKHNLTAGQIAWRRDKQAEVGVLFPQEYPETVEDCFLASGVSVFGDIRTALYTPVDATPQPDHRYVAGLDWGQANDYTALSVWDATEDREVALLRLRRMRWDAMRARVLDTCQAWGVETLLAEANSASSNLENLLDEIEAREMKTELRAFTMSNAAKAELVVNFYNGLHQDGAKVIDDPPVNMELRAFQSKQTASGVWTYGAPDSARDDDATIHDDSVIARLLARCAATLSLGFEPITI